MVEEVSFWVGTIVVLIIVLDVSRVRDAQTYQIQRRWTTKFVHQRSDYCGLDFTSKFTVRLRTVDEQASQNNQSVHDHPTFV